MVLSWNDLNFVDLNFTIFSKILSFFTKYMHLFMYMIYRKSNYHMFLDFTDILKQKNYDQKMKKNLEPKRMKFMMQTSGYSNLSLLL